MRNRAHIMDVEPAPKITPKITGYRNLSEDEIGRINSIKLHGESLETLCDTLAGQRDVDLRWVAIGRTNLQQGLMALVRAVAKPASF